MKVKSAKLAVVAFLMTCALPVVFLTGDTSSDTTGPLTSTGLGSVESLEANYQAWEAQYVKDGGDRNMEVALTSSEKGITNGMINAGGLAKLNWVDGIVSVEVNGLEKSRDWDVWLVDNSAESSIVPDASDQMVRAGTLKREGKSAKLEAALGSEAFADFEPDLVVVSEAGKSPVDSCVLAGGTTLFQQLHRSAQRGQFGVLDDPIPLQVAEEERGLFERLIDAVSPTADAQIGPIPNPSTALQQLITAGRQSFFNDTFQGNGRTCGTCHREDENLTITPDFIAQLPPNDPLFVAEFVPALASNFENPTLMRKLGLILENVDGFQNLSTKFVMRGVPHTLALLQNTLTPDSTGGDGTTRPPNERTGWGGDGAPVGTFSTPSGTLNATGTLRDFIIGAITQHYPKTLARVNGSDFILATTAQLNALEAFMKSTGRRADLILSGTGALSLKDARARLGQRIFTNPNPALGLPSDTTIGAGSCFLCHLNAGASDFFLPGVNANFNTNVESLPSQPADLLVPPAKNPPDGGFGATGTSPTGGFGNGSFNTPVLVEAADTPPFFHNNAIQTIEGAVEFYNSNAFNQPPGFGGVLGIPGGLINLQPTEVEAVAAFLRVINALENIRSSIDLEQRARNATSFSQAQELLKLSIAELADAIEVLQCGRLHFDARVKLLQAAAVDAVALVTSNEALRDALIDEAISLKVSARGNIRN